MFCYSYLYFVISLEHDVYVEDVMRKTLLSNWLKGTLSESVDGDSSETYLQRIFSLLTGMQIAEAMKLVRKEDKENKTKQPKLTAKNNNV
jgi:hypothetical protein